MAADPTVTSGTGIEGTLVVIVLIAIIVMIKSATLKYLPNVTWLPFIQTIYKMGDLIVFVSLRNEGRNRCRCK